MKKQYILGIVAFAIVAVLGVSMVSAFGFDGFMNHNLDNEDRTEMQEQIEAMQTAIENGDYETWKSLMEERIVKMQEQITEENFNKILEMHQQQEERRAEMEEQREQFCEENDCPVFEDGGSGGDSKRNHRFGMMGFEKPLIEDNPDSE